MEFGLAGKVILITGATQGVGAAIAREAARQHAEAIAVVGRSERKGNAIVEELTSLGAKAGFVGADLGTVGEPESAFARALEIFGRIDGLVNCAGITDRATFLSGDIETWERLFALNARAPYFLMQSFIRHRLGLGQPGSIVNIQSMNALCGAPELAIYSASKGALQTLTKNAANAHLKDLIRVNGINMGWSPTHAEHDMQSNLLGKGDGWLEEAARKSPLGRLLAPEEVARLTIYLLSDYSGLQTGTNIDLEQRVVGAP